MIDALVNLVAQFPGQKGRVRCFAHIVNLVVKIILRQFDSRVKKTALDDSALSDLARRLEDELENDEIEPGAEDFDEDLEQTEDDSTAGLAEVEGALKDVVAGMEAESQPVRLILTKVSRRITYETEMGADQVKPCALPFQPTFPPLCDPAVSLSPSTASKASLRH